jgi:ferrous iron transport protein B
LIFIPQIAFLFMFISILEESGYMSRVVSWWIKSCENLVYRAKCGAAYFWNCLCYSCYNGHKKHRNWKERLITILVTPFTTCSRLPVYAIIMHLLFLTNACLVSWTCKAWPNVALLTGFWMAIFSAYILNKILK